MSRCSTRPANCWCARRHLASCVIPTQLILSPQRKGGDLRTRSAGGLRPAVQLGCCLALVLVPLLLLATPQRATLHGFEHHAGARRDRANVTRVSLSTPWTVPVVFADLDGTPAP